MSCSDNADFLAKAIWRKNTIGTVETRADILLLSEHYAKNNYQDASEMSHESLAAAADLSPQKHGLRKRHSTIDEIQEVKVLCVDEQTLYTQAYLFSLTDSYPNNRAPLYDTFEGRQRISVT